MKRAPARACPGTVASCPERLPAWGKIEAAHSYMRPRAAPAAGMTVHLAQ